MRITPFVAILVFAACRPATPSIDLATEEKAVRDASQAFSLAERSGKPDSALSFFWEDAALQPPDRPQIKGHDAIRKFMAPGKLQAAPPDSAPPREGNTVIISSGGDMAAEWGRGVIVVVGVPNLIHFKYVTVWEKRGGVWKVRLNSWNADSTAATK